MAGAGGFQTGGGVTVVMDPAPAVYVTVFYPGSGPDRHLKKKADAVAILARALAPRRSGALASSIEVNQSRDELGRYSFGYQVGTRIAYGGYVHEGTGPSPRWAQTRKAMRFHGSAGDIVYRDFVLHPGTPAQPFLQDALIAMVD